MLVSASVYGEILAEEQAEEQLLVNINDLNDYHHRNSFARPSPSSASSPATAPGPAVFSGSFLSQEPFLVRHLLQEEKSSASVEGTAKEDFLGGSRRSSYFTRNAHDLVVHSPDLAGTVDSTLEEVALLARRLFERDVALATAGATSARGIDTNNTETSGASGDGDQSQVADVDKDKAEASKQRKESSSTEGDDRQRGQSQHSDSSLVKQTAKKVVTESVPFSGSIRREDSSSNGSLKENESAGQPVESCLNSPKQEECLALSGTSLSPAFVSSPAQKPDSPSTAQLDLVTPSRAHTEKERGDGTTDGINVGTDTQSSSSAAATCSPVTAEEDSCPYWCVNTVGCFTTKPVFHVAHCHRTPQRVSLLEEAEAFVARAATSAAIFAQKDCRQLRNPQQIPGFVTLRQAPRHLAVYVAEVSCRAYFDPQYRALLCKKYSR